ncbi:MAG: hypothetical protein BWY85_00036 [Firmicutes bacterium ADurb.Bin506]|nr:MAG: hypothetical protein BWY85_00036 [Firmicutes bacterium ADurb.Bin506]
MRYHLSCSIIPDTPMVKEGVIYSDDILRQMCAALNSTPCTVRDKRDGNRIGNTLIGTAKYVHGHLSVDMETDDCEVRPATLPMFTGILGAKHGPNVIRFDKFDHIYMEP